LYASQIHDVWPVRHQTYGYLPSFRAFPLAANYSAWWQRQACVSGLLSAILSNATTRSKTCSRHIFSHVLTSLTNRLQSTGSEHCTAPL